jgi:hypothetical protein
MDSGQGQLNQATTDYNQLGNQSMQAWGPSFGQFSNLLQNILPQLLQGQGSVYEAAFSPVRNMMTQMLRTMQNSQLGSTANPNALFQDMGQQATQQAGLAADQLLPAALSEEGQLATQGMQLSQSGLGVAGQGEAQIGETEQAQFYKMIESLMSGAGMALGGASIGSALGGAGAGGAGAAGASTETQIGVPSGMSPATGMSWGDPGPWGSFASGVAPAGYQSGLSQPISGPDTPTNPDPGGMSFYTQQG